MTTLSERFWSKVDTSAECWTWTASKRANGYGQINVDGKNRTAHRLSYELSVGPVPDGLHLDHLCRNRACVRPDHLRPVTVKQNAENRGPGTGASKVRGVRWDKSRRLWSAALTHHGQTVNVGRFPSITEAEQAITAARLATFTHNDSDRKAIA